MRILKNAFSGPVAQVAGLAIALASLIVSVIALPSRQNTAVLVQHSVMRIGDKLQANALDEKFSPDDLVYVYGLYNTASKSIPDNAYTEPLQIPKYIEGATIKEVDTCSIIFGAQGHEFRNVPFEWEEHHSFYQAKPRLLNAGEGTCIIVTSTKPIELKRFHGEPLLKFVVPEFRLTNHSSTNDAILMGEIGTIGLTITLNGNEIYAFLLIQSLLLLTIFSLYLFAAKRFNFGTVLSLSIMATGATICAEVFTYTAYGKASLKYVLVLPIICTVLISYAIYRAYKRERSI